MLSFLIISLIAAGVCNGQPAGMFSDCTTQQSIISTCTSTHLSYASEEERSLLEEVSELNDPTYLLAQFDLNSICNNTESLKMYYSCVYTDLSDCLEAANSTQATFQAKYMPDAAKISVGVEDMCSSREELNKTCILVAKEEVNMCMVDLQAGGNQGTSDPCIISEQLLTCAEKLRTCSGGDAALEFMVSAKPQGCEDTSAAGKGMLSVATLLFMLWVNLLVSWL